MSTANQELLDGSRRPGVYRVLDGSAEIAAELARAGWTAVIVPPAASIEAFYSALAQRLDLPDYFGRNLDALWDVLSDLDRPTALVLVEWPTLARAQPEGWARILQVLTERTVADPETGPAFALVLA